MNNDMKRQSRWMILIGVPVLFLMGSFLHFAYELSGENFLVSLIAPVNESVWEHMKMVVLPTILWWSIYYIWRGKKEKIDKDRWFTGAAVSLFVSLALIPLLYYFYTGAFGIERIWADIAILFIAFLVGQLLGFHVYRYGKRGSYTFAVLFMMMVLGVFTLFTLFPPELPIFIDQSAQ